MDKITICDLEVFYHVGVPAEERARAQRLLLTVEMRRDCRRAIESDDLSGTTDYFAVAERLKALGKGREWRLIETLAAEIGDIVRREFGVTQARVEVKKFILAEARHVSVTIERGG
ncbi:MAG: dihydroneopterin aldolase [Verrucomicrobia bacterium]|nr:dihydroneopterin aldolase [Verrucomicrobiota bacterium]MBI3870186.1 dihydroneopterin aldolase [Verrucomicrobiota bacterium]